MPADCLEKAEHTKIQEILFAKVHLSPRLPRKMNLTSAWQVQHEGGTEKPVAVGRTLEPKIDFRIQGIPHEEVEQDEEKSQKQHIGRLVSAIMNHEIKHASKTELQSKHPCTLFSEESKRFIHAQRKVESFELCENISQIHDQERSEPRCSSRSI